jgi:hypothetical protein
MAEIEEGQFLVQDYELKVRYLSDQFQRMWTRFNFFLTLEGAALGALFLSERRDWWLGLYGIMISAVWFLFGGQDRFLVRLYRTQVSEVAHQIEEIAHLRNYTYVGQVIEAEEYLRQHDPHFGQRPWFEKHTEFRFKELSITHLPAIVPLMLLLVWAVITVALATTSGE